MSRMTQAQHRQRWLDRRRKRRSGLRDDNRDTVEYLGPVEWRRLRRVDGKWVEVCDEEEDMNPKDYKS